MRRLSKTQFNRAIEAASDARTESNPAAPAPHKARHPSRIIVTAVVIVIGVGAGWLGGRVINGRIRNSPAAAPGSDPATIDGSTSQSPVSPQSHPRSKRTSGVALPSSQAAPEAEQQADSLEPRPTEPEQKVSPPKPTKVGKDDLTETRTAEDPASEIGRQALKKMLKDVKRMKRGLGNKNANENQPQ